jgi:hypothetical protein
MYEKRLFAILKLAEHMVGEQKTLFDVADDASWDAIADTVLDSLELDEMHLLDLGDFLLENGVENQFHR